MPEPCCRDRRQERERGQTDRQRNRQTKTEMKGKRHARALLPGSCAPPYLKPSRTAGTVTRLVTLVVTHTASLHVSGRNGQADDGYV